MTVAFNAFVAGVPAAGTLTGAELVPVIDGGVTSQTTTAAIAALGAGGGSTPATIPDCVLWIRGSNFKSTAGVWLPALGNLAPNTGGAFTPVSPNTSNVASISSTQLNGKNVISFPGTNGSVYSLGVGIGLNEFTGFIVWNPASLANYGNIICSTGNGALQWVFNQTTGTISLYESGIVAIGTSTVGTTPGTWTQSNAQYDGYTGNWKFRVGRAAAGSGTTTANLITANTIYVGQYQGNQYLDGLVAEIVVFNRALSSTEITTMETYLYNEYGV